MTAIELVHHMKSKVSGTTGDVAFKLDISKAYDRINWKYFWCAMFKMRFSHQ